MYIEDEKCSLLRPKKELKGFHKVELEPNEEKTIQFHIDINDLTFFDDSKQKWIAEPGKFKAYIAASSEDIRGVVEFELRCSIGCFRFFVILLIERSCLLPLRFIIFFSSYL